MDNNLSPEAIFFCFYIVPTIVAIISYNLLANFKKVIAGEKKYFDIMPKLMLIAPVFNIVMIILIHLEYRHLKLKSD